MGRVVGVECKHNTVPLPPSTHTNTQVMQSSSVYARLGERLGLTDHQAVLTVMLQKVATNLKVYGSSEQLVHLTLALFWVSGRCFGLVCFGILEG